METAAITTWLASAQPFAQGVTLYQKVGSSKTFLRLFKLGETNYSRGVLARELGHLVREVCEELPVLRTSSLPPTESPAVAAVVPSTLPPGVGSPALVQVRGQLRLVRDERSHAHAQLTAQNLGKKARYALASRILELTDQESELKAHEAHVLAHGRLPGPVPTAEVTDAGVLRQRLTNLLSQRSKLRKNPSRADDLASAEAEIILIRTKLSPN